MMTKRLLFLAPAPPFDRQGGGALRMLHLLRFLGSRFHVDLIAPAHEGMEDAQRLLKDVCAEMVFVPPQRPRLLDRIGHVGPYAKDRALAALVRERLASGEYGAVQVEKSSMLPYVPPNITVPLVLDVWSYGLPSPLRVLRAVNGGAGRSRQLIRLIKLGLFNRYCWPATHCVVVASDDDRIRCERGHSGRRMVVVPNGVDCRTILPKPDHTASSPVLLFAGDRDSNPISMGRSFSRSTCSRLSVVNFLRQNYGWWGKSRPACAPLGRLGRRRDRRGARHELHLRAATIFVAPHFTGSGTRTTLLEAMAAGLPIITTSIGIEGIKVQPGRDLLVADHPADMIDSIHTLLASQADRERFARAARHMAEIWYDWDRCLWPLEALYQELLDPKAVAC